MAEIIDKNTWPRREAYDFFARMSWPFYALTFPVDVTRLRGWCRREGAPFYPAMVYGVTKAMERVDAFHYKDRGGQIVRVKRLVPSFTDLHLSLELNHRLLDGAHVGMFYRELEGWMEGV